MNSPTVQTRYDAPIPLNAIPVATVVYTPAPMAPQPAPARRGGISPIERIAAVAIFAAIVSIPSLMVGMNMGQSRAESLVKTAQSEKAATQQTLDLQNKQIENFCKSVR